VPFVLPFTHHQPKSEMKKALTFWLKIFIVYLMAAKK
jgi:hypothetical protein